MGLSEQKAHSCCTVEVVSFSSYSLLLLTGRINEDIERSHHHIFSITNNNAKYSISSGSCCTSITHKIIFTHSAEGTCYWIVPSSPSILPIHVTVDWIYEQFFTLMGLSLSGWNHVCECVLFLLFSLHVCVCGHYKAWIAIVSVSIWESEKKKIWWVLLL